MTFPRRKLLNLMGAGLAAIFLFSLPRAQAQNDEKTASAAAPAVTPSPMESFRQMLALSPEEQKKYLSPRPPEIRQRLLEKLLEYRSLTAEEREMKLRSTELRWFVRPLMSLPPTNRAAQLAAIPATLRPQAAARIEEWDRVPAASQQTLLVHPEAIAYFTRLEARQNPPPRPVSPGDLLRRKLNDSLKRLVDLPPVEKEKTLRAWPDADRRQMDQTLQAFEKLKPAQRERCIRSFAAFATLSETERQEFLKSAERWAEMSPSEREAWRDLVIRAPIMPPGISPPLPLPGVSLPAKTNAG